MGGGIRLTARVAVGASGLASQRVMPYIVDKASFLQ